MKNIPVIVATILFLAAPLASASTMLAMTEEELVESSDLIVHGIVQDAVSQWNPQHTQIITCHRIKVLDTLKEQESGDTQVDTIPTEVSVCVLGGTVGELAQMVPGEARFQLDEEVVVFLSQRTVTQATPKMVVFRVNGMTQGKYSIILDAASNTKYVKRDLSATRLMEKDTQGNLKEKIASTKQSLRTLADLKQSIKQLTRVHKNAVP